jgi:translation initiation factor IF-2
MLLAGEHYGRVRALLDENGSMVESAGPSIPVAVLGLAGAPDAGEEFLVVADERKAREVAEFRQKRVRESRLARQQASKLENIFENMGQGEKPTVNIVLKTDVRGSLEALSKALQDLSTEEVKVVIVSSGVGAINESDVNLALTSRGVMIGFNVRADASAKRLCQEEGVDLRYYSVIYDIIDDIKKAMAGMLSPEMREQIVGVAEVRDVFRSSKFGAVAGCKVVEGIVYRNRPIRVLRNDVVVFEGELESLRRFKDDVSEVGSGIECGIAVKSYNDVRPGDKIEVFQVTKVARTL